MDKIYIIAFFLMFLWVFSLANRVLMTERWICAIKYVTASEEYRKSLSVDDVLYSKPIEWFVPHPCFPQ